MGAAAMSTAQMHHQWDAEDREAHRERLRREMERDSYIGWAERHIGMAMSMSTADEMAKHIGDGLDEFEIESTLWEAEYALQRAFGLADPSPLIGRFVRDVVPTYTQTGPRAHQLALIESGSLRLAISKLGRLLELPLEYAETLLEGIVKPFADVRTM